jgi:hypothetical protein
MSLRMRSAAVSLVVVFCTLLLARGQAEELVPPFPPPAQYTSTPSKPFDSLLAATIQWVQAKITDRKRRKRFEENRVRLPTADDKQPFVAAVAKLDGELREATAALAVLKAGPKEQAAQKQLVKSTVTVWINILTEQAESLRKDAQEAEERAKKATRQFDLANAQADVFEDKQKADKAEKTAKALADDLAAAGL